MSIGIPCSGFSFDEHFNRQFRYAVFYIQTRKICFSKLFYTNNVLFFALLGTASPLKTFQMLLHETKKYKLEYKRKYKLLLTVSNRSVK